MIPLLLPSGINLVRLLRSVSGGLGLRTFLPALSMASLPSISLGSADASTQLQLLLVRQPLEQWLFQPVPAKYPTWMLSEGLWLSPYLSASSGSTRESIEDKTPDLSSHR
jgi:hypothetical protein